MDEMPDFEPTSLETPAPKKPRRKPMKRKRVAKQRVEKAMKTYKTVVKRKKRRKVRVARKVAPTNGHASGKFTDEVYRTIGTLMGMKSSDRDTVLDIVKGLIA